MENNDQRKIFLEGTYYALQGSQHIETRGELNNCINLNLGPQACLGKAFVHPMLKRMMSLSQQCRRCAMRVTGVHPPCIQKEITHVTDGLSVSQNRS